MNSTEVHHASKHKVHKLHQRYIMQVTTRYVNCTEEQPLRMHLWWILCTLYLLACQLRVAIGISSLFVVVFV